MYKLYNNKAVHVPQTEPNVLGRRWLMTDTASSITVYHVIKSLINKMRLLIAARQMEFWSCESANTVI